MFGLRKRIAKLEQKHFMEELDKSFDKAQTAQDARHIKRLCERVADLEKALAWHVGTSITIMLAEEKIVTLKQAERREQIEEQGSAGTTQERMKGMVIHDGDRTEDAGQSGCN